MARSYNIFYIYNVIVAKTEEFRIGNSNKTLNLLQLIDTCGQC